MASARRSGVNTETKLLMLGHAFDELGCVAVEFRTHFFNFTSRAAIERLGAKLDGILRSHQLLPDGSRRDTVVYSILDIEWPTVRTNLRFRLDRTRLAPRPRLPQFVAIRNRRWSADRLLAAAVRDVDLARLGAFGQRDGHGQHAVLIRRGDGRRVDALAER